MQIRLEITSGPVAGQTRLIGHQDVLHVGRTQAADWVLPHDPELSGLHFALDNQAACPSFCDLNSTNGTFLNGQRIRKSTVNTGDELRAGRTVFRVSFEPIDSAASPRVSKSPSAPIAEQPSARPAPPVRAQARPATDLYRPRPAAAGVAPSKDIWSVIPAASTRPYRTGLQDPDPGVVREVLLAATWSRQNWLLEFCRRVAQAPEPNWSWALYLFGILAPETDLPQILHLGRMPLLGPDRFQILGAYGHPSTVDLLLAAVRDQDPLMAAAASQACMKILGAEILSDALASEPAAESSTAPEDSSPPTLSPLLDPRKAQAVWQAERTRFEQSPRWCCGVDMTVPWNHENWERLDLESQWEYYLRNRYHGSWTGDPLPVMKLAGP